MKIRPSALPALADCSCYESGPPRDFTERGTLRHKFMAALLAVDPGVPVPPPEGLDSDDVDGVQWFVEQVRLKAPMADYPLEVERPVTFLAPDFSEITGTPDVICGPVILDLKWRWDDYKLQMAAYALALLQHGRDAVTAYVCFAESRKICAYRFTRDECDTLLGPVFDRAAAETKTPTPCDWCGWCANAPACPALVNRAKAVAAGREDWELAEYHASKIESPEEMGKALALARQLADWCDSVEHHAREMAIKQGLVPAGFKLQSRQGNRYIVDVNGAFGAMGLPQDDFLAACEVKLPKLVDAYRTFAGIPAKAAAERGVETKLGDLIQRKPTSMSLVEVKPTKQENNA